MKNERSVQKNDKVKLIYMYLKNIKLLVLLLLGGQIALVGQYNNNKFKQLHEELPTPNVYRTASGAPGHEYWQQQADYKMDITLDDEKQRLYGEETITYHNNSPDELKYLWVQLDQNMRAKDAAGNVAKGTRRPLRVTFNEFSDVHFDFDGGFKLDYVKGTDGKDLPHTVNETMMRVELPRPMKKGDKFSFKIKWWYNINDRMEIGGRSGYEYFEKDDNYLYTIAQFFPRMCVYNDVEGWQNKQFLGRGEFALPFGDYEVNITAPADHLVSATGELQNASSILTAEQISKLNEAKTADKPIIIANQDEAIEREKSRSKETKTWKFKAENVRDFGFASSRKFIWDAQGVKFGDRTVMAMSFYPKEGNPLWEQYSTKAVVQTLETFSKHTFDYPYPVAQSINAANIGMEYPMICFNYGRCEEDGSYDDRTKYGMISVIIHEIGHNYFPMIVNSDERQWTWMDEGLNTFCQYLTEVEFAENFPNDVQEDGTYPSRRGPAANIVDYMKGDKSFISPIMTNSESIFQFGSNAYAKPATALNILRETVMGPELFDYAFKEYSQRWMFKHPTPADFFRTMEDASGTDLDWFWRSWFYTNENVDIAIDHVRLLKFGEASVEEEEEVQPKEEPALTKKEKKRKKKKKEEAKPEPPKEEEVQVGGDYFEYVLIDKNKMAQYISNMSEKDQAIIEKDYNYYQVALENVGGIPMPVILEFEFEDGTKETKRIPAELWKMTSNKVGKLFMFDKKVKQITLDPMLETADTDTSNNVYPPVKEESRFDKFKDEAKK